MIFLWFFLGVFSFFFIIFVIRRIFYRTKLLIKIKKKNVVNVKILNPLFLVSLNTNKKFDLYVETEDRIFYIKLFSIFRKSSQVFFNGAKEYKYKSFYLRSARYAVDEFHTVKMKDRQVGIDKIQSKSIQKVLLFCPTCRYKVSKYTGENVKQIIPGGFIDDYLFANTTFFIDLLEK